MNSTESDSLFYATSFLFCNTVLLSFAHQENSLVRLQKKRLEKVFEDCRMIAVVQNNNCNTEDMTLLKYKFYKHGISVKFFSNKVQIILVSINIFLKASIII